MQTPLKQISSVLQQSFVALSQKLRPSSQMYCTSQPPLRWHLTYHGQHSPAKPSDV